MITIYKYEIPITDRFTLELPIGAKILTVQTRRGNTKGSIWAIVESKVEKETRTFRLFGTGHTFDMGENYKYINTFQTHGGCLVWHLFEELNKRDI